MDMFVSSRGLTPPVLLATQPFTIAVSLRRRSDVVEHNSSVFGAAFSLNYSRRRRSDQRRARIHQRPDTCRVRQMAPRSRLAESIIVGNRRC